MLEPQGLSVTLRNSCFGTLFKTARVSICMSRPRQCV